MLYYAATAESIPYLGDILSTKTFLIKGISLVGETCAIPFSRYPQMQKENPDKQKNYYPNIQDCFCLYGTSR